MIFFQPDPTLQQSLDGAITATRQEFPTLAENQIAATWIVYDEPIMVNTGGALSPTAFWQYQPRGASYRGVERIYPASIVKLFYLVAVHEWLEREMIQPSSELDRAIQDMIIDSSNDATSLVIDILTGTTSGPELTPGPFQTWQYQRNLVNRFYASLQWPELATINVNQKTWSDGAYGRERIFLGEMLENRNMLTTQATARLLHSIVGGVAVSSPRSQMMMHLMRRDLNPAILDAKPQNQVTGFLGGGLPSSAQLWSKAGRMSQVRHDAAYIECDRHLPYLLVVFTEAEAQSQNPQLLPFLSQRILEQVPLRH
jgi:beta-lactamase class A